MPGSIHRSAPTKPSVRTLSRSRELPEADQRATWTVSVPADAKRFELRRVLRDDGRLLLGVLASWSAAGRAVFLHGLQFYEEPTLRALLAKAGFSRVNIDTINETVVPTTGQPRNRDYFIVSAE